MAFTAADVKTLREMTSVGMMDCKKALVECDGDMDKAVEWLREKGLAKAAKKAGRIAAEGMSYALTENGVGVVVEVNCETDFCAKSDLFVAFVKDIAKVIAEQKAPVVVEALRCRYPQGGEKQLCQAITGKQVPPGGLPSAIGCAVFNINTTIAIYHAIKDCMPVVSKVVTVSGSGVIEPKNLECPIGTPITKLFDACGGLKDETFKLIAGGPMMGMAQASADFPVAKGTGAVLAFAANENKGSEDPTCIRCGRCVEACPMHLEPLYLYLYVQKNRIEDLEAAHVMDCIECGACSYICPGRLHLTHSFKVGKQKVKEAAAKAKAAAEAAKAAEEAKKEA